MASKSRGLTAEILVTQDTRAQGQLMLTALSINAPSHGVGVARTRFYEGGHPILVLYGAGGAEQVEAIERHTAAGGIAFAWDMAYWPRTKAVGAHVAMRFGVNGLHPPMKVVQSRGWPLDRIRDVEMNVIGDPDGHVLIVGMGPKSRVLYGYQTLDWERKALADVRARWPDRKVVYRPKPYLKGFLDEQLEGAETWSHGTIKDAMRGASLIVTKHSNAALEAAIYGVPAVCEDGIAAALWPRTVAESNGLPPNHARMHLIAAASYFQWTPNEAHMGIVWPVLLSMIEAMKQ